MGSSRPQGTVSRTLCLLLRVVRSPGWAPPLSCFLGSTDPACPPASPPLAELVHLGDGAFGKQTFEIHETSETGGPVSILIKSKTPCGRKCPETDCFGMWTFGCMDYCKK